MTNRRYGRFYAPTDWAYQFRTELKRVMGQCIIVRAEVLFHRDQIEYYAISEHFRTIEEGEVPPVYEWIFGEDGDVSVSEVVK